MPFAFYVIKKSQETLRQELLMQYCENYHTKR